MKREIEQKISIDYNFLYNNVSGHLLDKLKKTLIGKCSLEHGYILKINKILKINENFISRINSMVVFDIVYEVDALKPEVGQHLSGTVCMVFKHGIFVDINGKMKVLIPVSSMCSYVYYNSYFLHTDGTKISVGVEVDITIVMVKYEKKEFSCIGKLNILNNT